MHAVVLGSKQRRHNAPRGRAVGGRLGRLVLSGLTAGARDRALHDVHYGLPGRSMRREVRRTHRGGLRRRVVDEELRLALVHGLLVEPVRGVCGGVRL